MIETYSCEYCGGSPHPGFDFQTGNTPNYDQGPCYNQDFGYHQPPFYSLSQPQQFDCCEFCGGPHYNSDCQAGNTPIYDQGPCYNQSFSDDQPPFYSSYQQQQFDCCEVCGGPHYSSDCQTRHQLVYEPNPGNNYVFPCFDQPPQYHIDPSPPQDLDSHSHFMLLARENNRILEEILRTQMPNSPVVLKEPEGSDDYMEVAYDKEKCLCDHYTAPIIPMPLTYTPTSPVLATIEPLDTFLMGDEVISTIPAREINEFIKSSVDGLVLILRKFELTLDSTDLECSMPIDPPLPCTDLLGDDIVYIDLPLGDHLDTLSTGDREDDFNPSRDIEELERLIADDPVPVLKVFDEPLGHSNSISRSFDVTFSNSLFDFNHDYTLCYDNPLFDEEFEDISSLDPLESTSVIDESTLLVTPLPDSKEFSLREGERFDPFFSLTQSGGTCCILT
ncbi:hypothetical protein Tco_0991411 [Tanacetum coccineum]|uniref:Uncharacterized protein n=1 Tax=Tanacetum coccineum TaxID=301880 RepID=A0ABQ5EZK4_9ASTR